VLQCVAIDELLDDYINMILRPVGCNSVLICVCCSVLQCVAVSCCALQCVAVCFDRNVAG